MLLLNIKWENDNVLIRQSSGTREIQHLDTFQMENTIDTILYHGFNILRDFDPHGLSDINHNLEGRSIKPTE